MKEQGSELLILPGHLFEAYKKLSDPNLAERFGKLEDAEISTHDFSFYTSVASVFSSKIEGVLPRHLGGSFRTQNMYVTTSDGKIEYAAALPKLLPGEMQKLYADINALLQKDSDIYEVFFFAAAIHLVFVKIHPFHDGNGHMGRLLEKWFLAQKLGTKAWFVQSEKHYYHQHHIYYQKIRALGLEYNQLGYGKALPFLLMLQQSVSED